MGQVYQQVAGVAVQDLLVAGVVDMALGVTEAVAVVATGMDIAQTADLQKLDQAVLQEIQATRIEAQQVLER
jgi:hypothetical protein